ncbi:alpha/beta fold hydrolase [Oricola cellulosilytica]|uniref:Alpha/beta fold hydrolase n=1 Tax=Oricola cellulosilytica TaxID=1429082 RepID=A0A4R0PEN9_9HYPH|nr:alpha/beta fold hydrolase [Oricola cellulosilytica]TCD15098.1 alpha/beta fold hydrolase [Oricola cellulosilytica]
MERETLVLLPGMMCDARMFAPQAAEFGSEYDVVIGDLSGERSISGLASGLLATLPPTFNLAGLSMGGIVAMEMAGQAPRRVKRLGLLDTNHRADAPERREIRNRQIDAVRRGRLRDVIVEEMKPNYLAPANRSNRALLDLLVDMAMDLGADVFVDQTLALRDREEQTDALRKYPGPALVLCGEHDTLCPPERHREIAGLLAQSELALIPDAGHISTLEYPEAVNTALRSWLARAG